MTCISSIRLKLVEQGNGSRVSPGLLTALKVVSQPMQAGVEATMEVATEACFLQETTYLNKSLHTTAESHAHSRVSAHTLSLGCLNQAQEYQTIEETQTKTLIGSAEKI